MNKSYEKMTVKELEKALQDLGDKIRALRAMRHEVKIEWNKRQEDIAAEKLVAGMSDKEKAKLRQVLGPEGIATKAGVGKPK